MFRPEIVRYRPRRWSEWLTALAILTTPSIAHAAANIAATPTFAPADAARASMDIGGVWNGTTEVTATTGDTFTLTLANNGDDIAYDLTLQVTLPPGFTYVSGTAAGVAGLSASQAGTTLTFAFPPNTDLANGASVDIDFGLTTDSAVAAGTYQVEHAVGYGTTDGATNGSTNAMQNVLILAGDTTIVVDPTTQTRAVADTATWDVLVTNTGLGGLFDVVIDESLLDPSPSGSLQITSMVVTAPAAPTGNVTNFVGTLPYLAPGETFVVQVEAQVLDCVDITNSVSTTDRTGATTGDTLASVVLDLDQPLITIAPPPVTLTYDAPVSVVVPVTSTGRGDAFDLSLPTTIDSLGVTVSNVGNGWTYDNAGTFTYTANGGDVGSGMSANLTFDLDVADPCASDGSGTIVWNTDYANGCGDPYNTPFALSNVGGPTNAPSISLSKTAAGEFAETGQPFSYAVTVGATNAQFIQNDPLTITDTLPADISNVVVGPAPAGTTFTCTGACGPGDTITWEVPLAALAGGAITLPISFDAPSDPCLGGTSFTNTASLTAQSTRGCALDASDSATITLGNGPAMGAVDLDFDITPAPDGAYETGGPDAAPLGSQEVGEGESTLITVSYVFEPTAPGSWSGSTFRDDFGQVALGAVPGQTLVPGTLQISVDGAGAQPVPPVSILSTSGNLRVDLAFIAGAAFADDTAVAGHAVVMTYRTTIPDADLGGAVDRSYLQRSVLNLNAGTGENGCQDMGQIRYTLPDRMVISRAAATVGAAMPSQLSVCEEFDLVLSVGNANVHDASNPRVTLGTGAAVDYEYFTPQPPGYPTYGGLFNAGNVVYSENGGVDPTWRYTNGEITSGGTITVRVRRRAGSGTTPTGFGADVDYDDNETQLAPGRDFTDSGSAAPFLVQPANLNVNVTPQVIQVTDDMVQWVMYIGNGGIGTAFGTTLEDTLPEGITVNVTATDAANEPAFPVSVSTVGSRERATWDLGALAAGGSQAISLVVDVNMSVDCDNPLTPGDIDLRWGCGGADGQTIATTEPELRFPDGKMQVVHDTTASEAFLCEEGTITIIARNTGNPVVLDVELTEILRPATTGLSFVPGSVEYSDDEGASWIAGADPTGAGTDADPHQWTATEIPPLARIDPMIDDPTPDVRVRFRVLADETANDGNRTIEAAGTGVTSCGAPADSPGTGFPVPLNAPNITLVKDGRNVTAGVGTHGESVFAVPGDVIEWRVRITNNGTQTARNVMLADALAGTGNTSATLDGPGHAGTAITSGVAVAIDDIDPGTTLTYLVTETLGATCVDEPNTASVTWGCGAVDLTTPTTNSDVAQLITGPTFGGGGGITQSFAALPGGRAEVTVQITNQASRAQNIVVTDDLPSGIEVDTTFAPTVTGDITAMTVNTTDVTTPVFTLTGTLDNGELASVRFRVRPSAGSAFDVASDPFVNPETTGNGLDPTQPATGTNQVTVDFESVCGQAVQDVTNATMNLRTPDLDVAVSPLREVVSDGQPYTYTFTVTNNGNNQSIADAIDFDALVGAGWTGVSVVVTTPGTGGTGGSCAGGDCAPGQLGTLNRNQSLVVEVTATANDNGSPLDLLGRVVGNFLLDDGTDTGDDYSLDEAQPKLIGFDMSKTRIGTSEAFTAGGQVAIGEEVTWRLAARWFGGTTITNSELRDTLPAGLGYVSHADQAGHDVGYTLTGDTPVDSGTLVFDVSNADLADGTGTFSVDVVTRVLNVAGNVSTTPLTNNFGHTLDAIGETFASDDPADGYGGSEPDLHDESTVTVAAPTITLDKQVRNVTDATAFADGIDGIAGDTLEYRVVIENTGDAPAFDVVVDDVLQTTTKLVLVDGDGDGVDNDGDGATDEGSEGAYAIGSGIQDNVSFDDAGTGLPAGQSLDQLDPGQTITLLYRALIDITAVPNDALSNDVDLAASTLSGDNGNQSASPGSPGQPDGERQLTATDTEDVTVTALVFGKSLITTAVVPLASPDVLIGEQVEFELNVVLPAGTIPNLVVNDMLPRGLSLVSTPPVTIGSSVNAAAPTITPAALPASGNPLEIRWDFGTFTVDPDPDEADRTITIRYVVQVRNIDSNVEGASLTNDAMYAFDGSPVNMGSVTLTVREANLGVTKDVAPAGPVDAGDVLTYTVSITNTSANDAFDVDVIDTLPAGVTYVPGSTTGTAGPAIGEPDDGGAPLTWGRGQAAPQDLDIAAGATLTYTYQVLVDDTVEPGASLQNDVDVTWTSLDGVTGPTDTGPTLGIPLGADGSGRGERNGTDGAGGTNDYAIMADSSLDVGDGITIAKTASGDTLAGGGFRVGDLVTYTIDIDLQEGTRDGMVVEDALPAGLAFFDFTPIAPASGADGFTYTAPAGPNAPTGGDTGTIAWTLGTVVNAGDAIDTNDTLTLVYRARVLDTGGVGATPTTQTLTNGALVRYQDADDAPQTTPTSDAPIDVRQPSLGLAKSLRAGQTVVDAGETVAYRTVVTNTGDGPAYNAVIRDVLPEGMRDATPAVVIALLDGAPVTLAQTYNDGTGAVRWTLSDAQIIGAGEQLIIDYDAVVDGDAGGGLSLDNVVRVQEHASQPTANPDERRVYPAVGPATTTVTTPLPQDIGKTRTPAQANVGETVTFTVTVPDTAVDVALFDVNVLDTVAAGLRVTSVTTNGGALGATVTDNTAGNAVDLDFDEIPAGERAIVTIEAVIENLAAAQTGTTFDNTASFTWASTPGGTEQPAITSPTVTSTVTEPVLTVDKVFTSQSLLDPGLGLQAGDTVTYTVTITNTGDGDAHDLDIRDIADDDLINPTTSANPDDPGAPANDGSSGGQTTWLWAGVPGPLAPGASYAFDVTFTIGAGVLPFQTLENTTEVDWTSTDGANADERDGSGGVNDYTASDATPVTITIASASITKTIAPPGVTSYAPGEEVVYRLVATAGQGQIDDLHVVDTLPAGLAFVSSALTVTNLEVQGGGAVSLISGPDAGDTGALDFEFGDVASTGPNPTVQLDVTVRVQDVPANVDGLDLVNDGRMAIEFPPGSGTSQEIPAVSNPQITLTEPVLVLALDGPAALDLGTPGAFTARVENTGTTAGYQPVIKLELPIGMRGTDPTTLPITLSIAGGRTLTLTAGTDYTLAYNNGTGRMTVTLISDAGFVDTTETLTIDFQATLDNNAVDGIALTPVGTVTDYASADTASGGNPDVRQYTTPFGTGTIGTANAASGDDVNDDAPLSVQAPIVAVTKAVDLAMADPADALHYTIVIENTGSIVASDVLLTDDLDPSLAAGTLRNVTVAPAVGTLTFDANGGVNGTGTIRLESATVAAGGTVTIEYDVDIPAVLPNGTTIFNQARVTLADFDDPIVSDSTSGADDDGTEGGNETGDPNDDDPVRTIIGSQPALGVLKRDTPYTTIDRTTVADPGDPIAAIRYAIEITNTGNEDVVNAILRDTIPSNTTYIAGTTTLNGAPAPDVGGTTPLVGGLAINTPGAPSGRLDVGGVVTVTFDVEVAPGLATGTVITNAATLEGEGEGTGPLPPVPSDDPDTDTPDDPTRTVVGNAPVIDAQKMVLDDNGGDLLPGETLTYIVVIGNEGVADATDVVFTDAMPADTTYAPGTITLDTDGFGGGAAVAQTDAADGDASAFAGGTINVQVGTIAPGDEVVVSFGATVDGGTAVGTVISNQGVVSLNEGPDEPTDVDGDDTNGDQPTPIVVGNAPAIVLTKQAVDLNGGAAEPGDVIEYVLVARSVGAVAATNVVITDPVPPPPTTYVAGTTAAQGLPVADLAGPASALTTGVNLGTIAPDDTRTLRFRVTIPPGTPDGTVIDNQATYAADGGLTGVSDSDLDDGVEGGNDGSNPNDDDPARLQVGGAPGTARVEGLVWLDLDHDRVFDSGEALQESWIVEILRSGTVINSAPTGPDGSYAFGGLPPGGGYQIRFRHPTTGTVWGNPVSSAPGVSTDDGTIEGLTLLAGTTVIDQNLPLDPSGVVYDAITRAPVPGAIVNLVGPAGFDPDVHLLPGQPNQTTGTDGFYRFDLVGAFPAGTYTIEVIPPDGYLPETPSSIIPPETASLDPTGLGDPLLVAPQTGPPANGQSTTYYLSFVLAAGDPNVVNNHIPLDPFLDDALLVTKTTPKINVSVAELVPYTITITNTTEATLSSIELRDLLPPGFKYVDDSATLDGQPVEVVSSGRVVRINDLTIAPQEERLVTMILVVGTGVGEGEYTNQAWAVNQDARRRVSNIGEATVRVIPDPTFDCAELIGTVFLDRNQDGYQNDGEPGIPAARVVTVNGLRITTDDHGRYHITCAAIPQASRGSNFIIKLDERSLPSGYRITTENPRVVRLTRGKMTKANFGVAISRVVRIDLTDAAFVPGEAKLTDETTARFGELIEGVAATPSVLRVAYRHGALPAGEVKARVDAVETVVRDLWRDGSERPPLLLEREIIPVALVGTDTGTDTGTNADVDAGAGTDAYAGTDALAGVPAPPVRQTTPRPAVALDDADDGKIAFDSMVVTSDAPPNTERAVNAPAATSPSGFAVPWRVSIDGAVVDQGIPVEADVQRTADLDLEAVDIRLRFDPAEQTPLLNVTAAPNAAAYGETVRFTMFTNYAAWIDRAEVRLFRDGDSPLGEPFATLPVDGNGVAEWTATADHGDIVRYVLRVYDPTGLFDETLALQLGLGYVIPGTRDPEAETLAGYGQNHLHVHNIQVTGGAVTVDGDAVPPGHGVHLMGRTIPVDSEGNFVGSQILPPGKHNVTVSVIDGAGDGMGVARDLYIPDEHWFYVAIADLTVGGNGSSGPAPLVSGDSQADDSVYFNGRLAFYLKGHLKGDWILTASADTGEGDLSSMFSDFSEKDPRVFLRRLDSDQFYPVYGDDSTTIEDAPTNGKLYVRIERGESFALWGNFYTRLTDTELAQIDRALYGAQVHYQSEATTEYGEARAQIDGFAAAPETVAARDDFRGTGGSLYYLHHTDILIGSERLRIEVRDKDTGLVLEVRALSPFDDYVIDPLQGRILLRQALPSIVDDHLVVRTGSLSGNPVFLVARYEYVPDLGDINDLAVGGRGSAWVNDHVQVGVSGSHQDQEGDADQDLIGGDLTVRLTPQTYIRAEIARTDGLGNGERTSYDGGFGFVGDAAAPDSDPDAIAWLIEGAAELSEITNGTIDGKVGFYYKDRQAGFSAPGQFTLRDVVQYGVILDMPLGEKSWIRGEYDGRIEDPGRRLDTVEVDFHHELDEHWYVDAGVRFESVDDDPEPGLPRDPETGNRTDGTVQVGYNSEETWDVYGFAQGTLARSGDRDANNRFGGGGNLRLNDRLTAGGEVSGGDGGLGTLLSADYLVTDKTSLYIGYESGTERTDYGQRGRTTTLTTGARMRFNENVSVYTERRRIEQEGPSGLTNAYGIDLTFDDKWVITGLMETGRLQEREVGEMDRLAVAASIQYAGEKLDWATAGEWRSDRGDLENRTSWLFRTNISCEIDPSWRVIGKLDIADSDSDAGAFFDGGFIEAAVGAAVRPVTHDKLNMLFKYTYFSDTPASGQVDGANIPVDFSQRSHILSIDAIYDLVPQLSIGAKYGLRYGQLRTPKNTGEWFTSSAQLGVLRLDWHVVKNWDAVVEGRWLYADAAEDQRIGALVAVYRHVGDNMKIGVGYNFTDFSDDLTDLSYDHQGWFVNVIGKF